MKEKDIGSIYWKKLPKSAKIRLEGACYYWGKKIIYWDGKEIKEIEEANKWLKERATKEW